jgi:sulfonate transport system permease protein
MSQPASETLPIPAASAAPRASASPSDGSSQRRRRRLGPGKPTPLGGFLGPLLALAVWSVGSAAGWIDPRVLPAPWTVATTAADLIAQGRLQQHLATSIRRVGEGVLIGVPLGVALALISGLTRIGEYLIDGLVQIKRAIPPLAMIPLFMLWFGIGEGMKVTVVTLMVFAPIYLYTHDGLRSIDRRYVELAETLRVGHGEFVRHVVLPGALPGFFQGLRYAVIAAWLALVVVEQVNSTSGIGYMIELARNYGQTNVIVLGLAVYALLGLFSDHAVRLLQKRALSWRRIMIDY